MSVKWGVLAHTCNPAFRGMKQEDQEFGASQNYTPSMGWGVTPWLAAQG